MRKCAPLLAILLLASSAGCDRLLDWLLPLPGQACTLEFRYGMNLALSDPDGDPVAGATVTLTDGSYEEEMMELEDGQYVGAGERGGTYTMVIEAAGFQPRTIENIVVDEDECHVIPESFDVTLSPDP